MAFQPPPVVSRPARHVTFLPAKGVHVRVLVEGENAGGEKAAGRRPEGGEAAAVRGEPPPRFLLRPIEVYPASPAAPSRA